MNTPVSFEIAKLLKEKEFEEQTLYAFKIDGTRISFGNGVNANLNYNHFRQNNKNALTSSPTIAQVLMWLYETHDIWIGCTQLKGSQCFDCDIEGETITKMFISPIEAYEAGINHCLTKLI